MLSINPKYSAYIAVGFAIVGALGQIPLPDYVPMWVSHDITQTCTWLSAIGNGVNAVLHFTSPAQAGPLGK